MNPASWPLGSAGSNEVLVAAILDANRRTAGCVLRHLGQQDMSGLLCLHHQHAYLVVYSGK